METQRSRFRQIYLMRKLLNLANNLRDGVPIATPVFDGATEEEIKAHVEAWLICLKLVKPRLYDGRTGDAFDRPVTLVICTC